MFVKLLKSRVKAALLGDVTLRTHHDMLENETKVNASLPDLTPWFQPEQ